MHRPHHPTAALALFSVLTACVAARAIAEDVVARVNGIPISRRQLNDVIEGTLALDQEPPDAATRTRLQRAALESLIEFELLYQASVAHGAPVSDAEVLEEIARNRSRFPNDASFREALARKGLSPEALELETRRMIAVNNYIERTIGRSVNVTAESVGEFYRENRDQFHRPEQVRASHILIRVEPGAAATQREQARAKAEALLVRLRDGADFADLARRSSEDRATADEGGDLGFFSRGTMVEQFETPVFSLAPGQITSVFETKYGFHIAKVTDRKVAGVRPLEEVSERIRDHLMDKERARRQRSHVDELRRRATVEIYDAELAGSRQ